MGSFIQYVRKVFRKTSISYPSIRTRTCAYQGIRYVSFSENFEYVLNESSLQKVATRAINNMLVQKPFQHPTKKTMMKSFSKNKTTTESEIGLCIMHLILRGSGVSILVESNQPQILVLLKSFIYNLSTLRFLKISLPFPFQSSPALARIDLYFWEIYQRLIFRKSSAQYHTTLLEMHSPVSNFFVIFAISITNLFSWKTLIYKSFGNSKWISFNNSDSNFTVSGMLCRGYFYEIAVLDRIKRTWLLTKFLGHNYL